jgi:signal transduction histidine kinase
VLGVVTLVDAALIPGPAVGWLYALPVLFAAAGLPPRAVAGVGALAVIAQTLSETRQGARPLGTLFAVAGLVLIAVIAVILAYHRDRAERERADNARSQLAAEHTARDAAAERSRRLRALHDAALALASPAPADREAVVALLGRIVACAREALNGLDAVLVLASDPAWSDLLPGSDAEDGALWLDYRGELGRRRLRAAGATAFVLASGRPVEVEDTTEDSAFGRYALLAERGVRAFAVVPLHASGRVIGALSINFAMPRTADSGTADLLALFAAHAAAALDRMRLAFSEHQVALQGQQLVRQEAEADALRKLDRLKDELLETIAHELRTPLTVLYGYALRLRARADRIEPSAVEQTAERMLAAAGQLKRLVEDLLDFGHLQRGEVVVCAERVDLATLLQGLVEAFRTHSGGERIAGDWPERLTVYADPARLAQVVGNLLENALRYAPTGLIALSAAPLPPDGQMVRIEVKDRGPGIPAAEQGRVWDRFFRGSGVAGLNVARGSGIGLAVVKTLVEAQGGRVGLESAPGRGSCFWLEIPAATDPDQDSPPAALRADSRACAPPA